MGLFAVAIALSCIQLSLCDGPGNSWQTLTVKFDPPPLIASDPYAYNKMPMTCDEAKSQEWKLLEFNEQYKGDRYIDKDGDPSVILIYCQHSGRLFGMQSQFPAKDVHADWVDYFENTMDMFTTETRNGEKFYILTAFTIDPANSTAIDQCEKGVGCDLYFLLKDSTLWKMPKQPSQMKLGPGSWTEAKCVDGMGKHYLWDLSLEMDCKTFKPFFLIYAGGNLSGFGWQVQSHFTSPRLESPPRDPKDFFYTIPTCVPLVFDQVGGINSLHFYFNDNPKDFKCDA